MTKCLLTIGREVVRELRGKTSTPWLRVTLDTNPCLFLGQAEFRSLGFVRGVDTLVHIDEILVFQLNRVLAFVFYESGRAGGAV
jgi:hypothetical protein